MSSTRQDVQDELLKAARRGQAVLVEVIRTSAGIVNSARSQDRDSSRPFSGKLPSPEQLAGTAREFASKLRRPEQTAGTTSDTTTGSAGTTSDTTGTTTGTAGDSAGTASGSGSARDVAGTAARQLAERLGVPGMLQDTARQFAGRLPASPEDMLPRVEEFTASARQFTEKVLAGQQKLAEDVLRSAAAWWPRPTPDGPGGNSKTARSSTAQSDPVAPEPTSSADPADATFDPASGTTTDPIMTTTDPTITTGDPDIFDADIIDDPDDTLGPEGSAGTTGGLG